MENPDIIFPHLGIDIQNIDPVAFTIFGTEIYWYGILICSGIVAGLLMAMRVAKKTNQNPEDYSELLIYALIAAIVGARLYYVAFSWNDYKDNLMDIIFGMREGGLAIYGGVIGGVIGTLVFSKVKKKNVWLLLDTAAAGMILGQAIGRWGNFMNMEAFGGYTDSFMAMAIDTTKAKYIPADLIEKITVINGASYIQVQPTFLYESLWCILVLGIILFYTKHKKFHGEIFCVYLLGYGLGRVWIEGLRTDQLFIANTIPVSQLLSGVLIVGTLLFVVLKRRSLKKG